MTRPWRALGWVLAGLVVLAGCAPPAPDAGTPPAIDTPAATDRATAPAGGGTLRVSAFPISQIDPAFISSDAEVLIANHVYDYLVDIDAENNIAPRLATEWTVSEDGRVYVFTLAEGVLFHDGTPLSPEDVVWTFDRLRDPAGGLPTVDLYAGIEAIEVTGEREVTFTLAESNPFFLYDLSDNHALILREGTTDAASVFNGTGPFTVVEYMPEDRLVMRANPDYFGGPPALDGLEIIFFSDQTAAADALRGGQIDLDMDLSTPLYESLREVEGITTVEAATNAFAAVRLRMDREPGSDPRVMQALKMATDREAIFQLVQQGYGAIGRDSPIGPVYAEAYSEDTPLPPYDVEAARALLAEAGYGDGLSLDLHLPNTLGFPDLAVVLKEQWAMAGVDVEVLAEPESVYYGEDGWLEVNLGITGWGHRPYPQFYLEVMLACGAIWNEAHWRDEELDALIDIAGTTLDDAERAEAYREVQRILIERGPLLVPYFFPRLAAHREDLVGFALKPFSGRTDLRGVSLAAAP